MSRDLIPPDIKCEKCGLTSAAKDWPDHECPKPEAPTLTLFEDKMLDTLIVTHSPAKAQAPGAREWWICKHGEDIVHNLKSRWVSEVPIEIKTAEYFHVIEYAAYEALERELAEACAARDQWRSTQQALNQARAELAAQDELRKMIESNRDQLRIEKAALVELLEKTISFVECLYADGPESFDRKKYMAIQQVAREALKKYGGGE